MKLEVCDKYNPFFVRVATIVDMKDKQLKIHLDGWKDDYDYWVDEDSEEIYPIFWCEKTGHPLEKPSFLVNNCSLNENEINCPTPGCYGIGHVKGSNYLTHRSESGCPYRLKNINKDFLPYRLTSTPNANLSRPFKKYKKGYLKNEDKFSGTLKRKLEANEDTVLKKSNIDQSYELDGSELSKTNGDFQNKMLIKRGRPKKLIINNSLKNFQTKNKLLNKVKSDLVKMQMDEIKSI